MLKKISLLSAFSLRSTDRARPEVMVSDISFTR